MGGGDPTPLPLGEGCTTESGGCAGTLRGVGASGGDEADATGTEAGVTGGADVAGDGVTSGDGVGCAGVAVRATPLGHAAQTRAALTIRTVGSLVSVAKLTR